MTPTVVLAWAEDHPALAITAAVLAIAVIALVVILAMRTATRTITAIGTGVKKLDAVIVGAAGVALLATFASIEAMWVFLRDELDVNDAFVRAAIVGIFDVAAFVGALLSREARTNNPGKFGADSLIVWAVACLLGYFGAAEAIATEAQVFRFAIPILAAVMWDRVVHRDVSRKVAVDKAKMATVTGRIIDGIASAARSMKAAVVRQGARWGVFQPSDEDTATIRRNRWHRQLISRAAKAADALRAVEATESLPADNKRRERALKRYDRTVPPFRAAIVAGQQLGAIKDSTHLQSILWDAAVVIRAEDALSHATGQSPWSTDPADRPEPVGADRPDVIDGEVIDRPTETDRPTGRTATDPTDPTDRNIDRPTAPIDRPTDRPTTPEPADTPIVRPNPDTGRTIQPAPRPTDRTATTTTRRRSKEENERLIITALDELLGDADVIAMPSAGAIARTSAVSKSTVQAFLGRNDLSGAATLHRDVLDDLKKITN